MKTSPQSEAMSLPIVQPEGTLVQRNRVARALKSVFASSHPFLPNAVYKPLYDAAFRTYKGLLRLSYSRHVLFHAAASNHERLTKAKLVHSVMPYSLVGSSGLEATFAAASDLVGRKIPGDFIECGVAQGGCSALMATVAKADQQVGRRMWLFDSFQGLPDPTEEDYDEAKTSTGLYIRPLPRGSCLGSREQVESLLFSKFGLSKDSVFLVEGWFQDTLPVYRERIGQIALLRIDGDWYEPTLCCLQHLYDLVTPGGWVIIDDYGVCFGCKKAVDEFLKSRGLYPQFMTDGRGGVLFSKPL